MFTDAFMLKRRCAQRWLIRPAQTSANIYHACTPCRQYSEENATVELQKFLPANLEAVILQISKIISLLGAASRKIWPRNARKTRARRHCAKRKTKNTLTKSATMQPWKLLATRRKRENQNAASILNDPHQLLGSTYASQFPRARNREVVKNRKGFASYSK